MSQPDVLTKTHFVGMVCVKQAIDTHIVEPDGSGYVLMDVDFNLDLDPAYAEADTLEEEGAFTISATVDLQAFSGVIEDRGEDDEKVASALMEMIYIFACDEPVAVEELKENQWAFELMIRPMLLTRLRLAIRDTPIANIPISLY